MSDAFDLRLHLKKWLSIQNEIQESPFLREGINSELEEIIEKLADQEWKLISYLQCLLGKNTSKLKLKGLKSEEEQALNFLLDKSNCIKFTPEKDPEYPFVAQWFLPWVGWNDDPSLIKKTQSLNSKDSISEKMESWCDEVIEEISDALGEDVIIIQFGYWDENIENKKIHFSEIEGTSEEEWGLTKMSNWLNCGVIPILIRGKTYQSIAPEWDGNLDSSQGSRFFIGNPQSLKASIQTARIKMWKMWSSFRLVSFFNSKNMERKTTIYILKTGSHLNGLKVYSKDFVNSVIYAEDFFELKLTEKEDISFLLSDWLNNENPNHQIELIFSPYTEKVSEETNVISPDDLIFSRVLH